MCFRVSSASQSNDAQRIHLVEFAERNGYDYDTFEEVESTRKTRPVKQALLAKLRAGEYDAVVVYKLDRWARSSQELILDTAERLFATLYPLDFCHFYSYIVASNSRG